MDGHEICPNRWRQARFHADKEALESFYGAVKPIPKTDLESGLREATKNTRKGNYYDHKTTHGPKLLAAIDPDRVQDVAPHCRELFDAIFGRLAEPGTPSDS